MRDEDLGLLKRKLPKKNIPFDFVLEALGDAEVFVRPMFGCHAIYVGEKIVLILRDRATHRKDNGVWLATSVEHHESLKEEFRDLRSLSLFGTDGPTNWQLIPKDSEDFETAVLRACELVLDEDERIGRVPKPRSSKKKGKRKK